MRIDFNTEELRGLERLAREAPKEFARALNDTAFKIRTAEQDEMRQVFDRPTAWTLRGVQVSKAKTTRYHDRRTGRNVPELTAIIGGTDYFNTANVSGSSWDRVIAPHVYGGTRLRKQMEKRLERAGLLPSGWYIVPGAAMRLNAHGNIIAGHVTAILSWVGAMGQYSGDNLNRRDRLTRRRNAAERRGESYFVARVGNRQRLHPGIYLKRSNGLIAPMLMFVSSATYSQRLDWFGVAAASVRTHLPQALTAAFGRLNP